MTSPHGDIFSAINEESFISRKNTWGISKDLPIFSGGGSIINWKENLYQTYSWKFNVMLC